MDFATTESIHEAGFRGFVPIADLTTRILEIPDTQGVYLVVSPDGFKPEFAAVGTGGFFKGRNPNVALHLLLERWVDGARVLNIGKAGGASSSSTLRKRVRQYVQFGRGKAIGHWGGRYVWQLKDCTALLICWKETANEPRDVERALIATFREHHGVRPFANLQG